MSTDPLAPHDLTVHRRRGVRWLWIPLVAAIGAVAWWWVCHPTDLPSSDRVVSAQVKVGQTIYLGVPEGDVAERTIRLRDVTVTTRTDPESAVTTSAWVCTDGSISQSSTPEAFCAKWSEADGAELKLGGGDQLVVGVTATSATVVEVTGVEVDFTDGLQRGSSNFGPRFEVTFLG